ncbi:50S ribosomal protein L18 [Patescibacteria group bacterium]|nr:50S ribosomal protein L18 [Patescibacteria group bacterium]
MKTIARQNRHRRVRSRVSGTAERPRLVVFRGTKTLSAQLIDDAAGTTLFTVRESGSSVETAKKVGATVAGEAGKKKVTTVVFDRAGYAYHGIVQAVADAAREGGLKL